MQIHHILSGWPAKRRMEKMGLALQPLSIGNIELKNRLLLAPSGTGTGDGDGHITEDTLR